MSRKRLLAVVDSTTDGGNNRQGKSRTPSRVKRKEEKNMEFWEGLPPSDALDCQQCDSCICTECEAETDGSDGEDFYQVKDYE